MKARNSIALAITLGLLVAAPLQVAASQSNSNATVQVGQVNINRTSQCGEVNTNSTYQEGRVNINQTNQRSCTQAERGARGKAVGHDDRDGGGRPPHAAARGLR